MTRVITLALIASCMLTCHAEEAMRVPALSRPRITGIQKGFERSLRTPRMTRAGLCAAAGATLLGGGLYLLGGSEAASGDAAHGEPAASESSRDADATLRQIAHSLPGNQSFTTRLKNTFLTIFTGTLCYALVQEIMGSGSAFKGWVSGKLNKLFATSIQTYVAFWSERVLQALEDQHTLLHALAQSPRTSLEDQPLRLYFSLYKELEHTQRRLIFMLEHLIAALRIADPLMATTSLEVLEVCVNDFSAHLAQMAAAGNSPSEETLETYAVMHDEIFSCIQVAAYQSEV